MDPAPSNTAEQTCYRHKDSRAGVRCQRCERPICPKCMHTASVGFHCPECTKTGKQKVYTRATINQAPGMRPVVTQVLLAVNVAVFLGGIVADLRLDIPEGVYNPLLDGSIDFLSRGAISAQGLADGEWWRIFTAGFLHIGIIHLALNMFALYRLGPVLEPMLGRSKFAAAYLTSLVFGSLGVMVIEPARGAAGASGAIFGLFGVLLLATRARGIDPWANGIAMTIGLNFLFTFSLSQYISVGGHVGGFAGGVLCGYVLFDLGPKQIPDGRQQVALLAGLGLAAAVGCIILA